MTPAAVRPLLTHLHLLMMVVLLETLKVVPVAKAAWVAWAVKAVKVANKVDLPARETRWVVVTMIGTK